MEQHKSRVRPSGGHGEGPLEANPNSPGLDWVKLTCSFCGQVFEVERPSEGGRIRGEVRCAHCARTGIVAYGEIGNRTLVPDRRRRDRRGGRDRRQT